MLHTAVMQTGGLLLVQSRNPVLQQIRNTWILKRMYPVTNPNKNMKDAKPKGLRHQIYIKEAILNEQPAGNLDVLLTRDILGVGGKGDVVKIPKILARKSLLPLGIALYPTPDNILKYSQDKEESKEEKLSEITSKTIAQLKKMNLPIPMNPNVNWILDANHVRLAFRKIGVTVPLNAITMPKEPITEPQAVNLNIRINQKLDIPVKATVYPYMKDSPKPDMLRVWTKSKQTIEDAIKALDLSS